MLDLCSHALLKAFVHWARMFIVERKPNHEDQIQDPRRPSEPLRHHASELRQRFGVTLWALWRMTPLYVAGHPGFV